MFAGFFRSFRLWLHGVNALSLGFFALLAFLMMNVVALDPARLIIFPPDVNTDYYHFHWNFWWARHALFDLQQPVYFTGYLHVPFEQNLGFHTLTLSWLPLYLLLEPALGQILVVNLMLWLTLLLNGFLVFVLLRTQHLSARLALLAGTLVATSPYVAWHLTQFHMNVIAVFWLPASLLLWRKVARTRGWGWALLLGLAFWAMWLTDLQWLLWAPFLLIPYGISTLLNAGDWPTRARLIALGLLAIALMLALAWFVAPLQPMLDWEGEVSPAHLDAARYWSLSPEALTGQPEFPHQDVGTLLLLLALLALILPSGNLRRWWWFAAGLAALLIALGPDMQIGGRTIALPYRQLHDLFDGVYRTPNRFFMVSLVAFSAFAGLSLQPWLKRLPRQGQMVLSAALVLLILADSRALQPQPARHIPDYDFYHDIASTPGDFVLVHAPLSVANGWNTVGKHRAEQQFYMMTHQKRMVNGFVAREPSNNYLYYELSPLWKWLAGSIPLDFDAALAEWQKVDDEWPVGYVIIDQNYFHPNHPRTLEWIRFFNSLEDFCQVDEEAGFLVYRSAAVGAGCPARTVSRIDLGADDESLIGPGWYWNEDFGGRTSRWMGQSATLFFTPDVAIQTIQVDGVAFHRTREVTFFINDEVVDTVSFSPGDWQTVELRVPASIQQGEERLRLRIESDSTDTAAEVLDSSDERELSIAISNLSFTFDR